MWSFSSSLVRAVNPHISQVLCSDKSVDLPLCPMAVIQLSSKYYLGLAKYLISNASCVIILKSKAIYKIDYL
jgi:hypothetical protein